MSRHPKPQGPITLRLTEGKWLLTASAEKVYLSKDFGLRLHQVFRVGIKHLECHRFSRWIVGALIYAHGLLVALSKLRGVLPYRMRTA